MRLARIALACGVTCLFSQQTTIRVDVELLQIEAVVTDGKGHRVPGLAQEDFQLLVDGKEKKISHFSYVDFGKGGAASAASRTASNAGLRREQVNRTIVFMIDELHTSPDNLVQLAPVVRRFAEEQIQPGDMV